MKKSRLPSLPNDHDQVPEDHQENESDENNIETEKIEALRVLFAHILVYWDGSKQGNETHRVYEVIDGKLPVRGLVENIVKARGRCKSNSN